MLEQIFSLANGLAMLGWLLLILLPHRRWTQLILHRGLLMALLGVAYAVFIAQGMGQGGGFGSIEQVRALFQSDAALLAGWLHYLAFDLFVGAWITRDARRVGIRHLLIVLPLLLTFMLGPVGFLLYFLIRLTKVQTLSDEIPD
ncbi:MAG: DUF4281 domain-containing protein [Bacteroidetes bacterium]|nr:MAG: DUF4281 domain-containing protein [Bacteroidota bacterium]